METLGENLPLANEKMLDMKGEDRLALAAWSDNSLRGDSSQIIS